VRFPRGAVQGWATSSRSRGLLGVPGQMRLWFPLRPAAWPALFRPSFAGLGPQRFPSRRAGGGRPLGSLLAACGLTGPFFPARGRAGGRPTRRNKPGPGRAPTGPGPVGLPITGLSGRPKTLPAAGAACPPAPGREGDLGMGTRRDEKWTKGVSFFTNNPPLWLRLSLRQKPPNCPVNFLLKSLSRGAGGFPQRPGAGRGKIGAKGPPFPCLPCVSRRPRGSRPQSGLIRDRYRGNPPRPFFMKG